MVNRRGEPGRSEPPVFVLQARSRRRAARRAAPLPGLSRADQVRPRAEGFPRATPALQDAVRARDAERLPILVHAVAAVPALGRTRSGPARRHPDLRLILAHAGISDLGLDLEQGADQSNLSFDTASWSGSDIQALFALVRPQSIP